VTVAYRVSSAQNEADILEIEPITDPDAPGAWFTTTDGQNPAIAVKLNLAEISELRDVLARLEGDLKGE
jgi:hypothetical protein